MTLSVNDRAAQLADRLADDADALRVAVTTLRGGTRVIDCGSAVAGGLEAGRRFAEITMGGLGWVAFAPVVVAGRSMPGLVVVTDHPALACLAAQYAGWQIKRDGYFAMASGPGRAPTRAEDLYDDLDVDERASAAVLCLETRDAPPDELAVSVAESARGAPGAPPPPLAPTPGPSRRPGAAPAACRSRRASSRRRSTSCTRSTSTSAASSAATGRARC